MMTIPNILPAFQLSLRAAVASGLAVGIAHLLQLQHPIYALISAVLVTDLSPAETRRLGFPRMVGTIMGAVIGGIFGSMLQTNPVTIGLSILMAMFLSHLMRLQDTARVAGYISGIALLNHGDQPWHYAFFRLSETALGIAVAVLISFFPMILRERSKHDRTQSPV